MSASLQLWADWIGSLAGPLRFGVFALVLGVVAVLLLFAYAVVGQFLGYLLEERIRVRLPMTPEPDQAVEMQRRLITTLRPPAAKGIRAKAGQTWTCNHCGATLGRDMVGNLCACSCVPYCPPGLADRRRAQ